MRYGHEIHWKEKNCLLCGNALLDHKARSNGGDDRRAVGAGVRVRQHKDGGGEDVDLHQNIFQRIIKGRIDTFMMRIEYNTLYMRRLILITNSHV